MIEMILDQKKSSWIFTAMSGGEVIAELEAIPFEDKAIIHNRIFEWNKTLFREYREMFRDIRGVLKESGISLAVAVSDSYTIKMDRYWRMMGFADFGECVHEGKTYRIAVMGA